MDASPTPPDPTALPDLPDREGIGDEERALGAEFRARYAAVTREVIVHRLVPSPRVTLAVISHKAKDYLLECLQNLRGQSLYGEVPYEILLVDNGGIDHLHHRYRNLVDVEVRLTESLKPSGARNVAAAWARGELVANIDDDGMVSPEWLEHALRAFEDPSVSVARGKIVPHRHPYYNTFAVHYDRGDAPWDDDALGTEGNMMIRRQVYLAVGGFPDEVHGAEGVCLAYRIKKANPRARSAYVPGMRMEHDYARTVQEFVWKCRRYRTATADATSPDPELRAYLEDYYRRPKPSPKQPWDEWIARRALKAAAWAIRKIPVLDRVTRR